jgi:type I restriction enzyme, S subunit
VRFGAYPSYKPSGVEWLGDVPSQWQVKRGRFCMCVNPRSNRLRDLPPEDEVSFVPMEAVGEYGGLDLELTRAIADVGAGYTEFEEGDVIVAKITPCFENGKGALAAGLLNGAAFGTTELHVLRVSRNLDCRFLFYLTRSRAFRGNGEGSMYGAGGQKRVPSEFCENFPIPLPPLVDQHAAADFLDRGTGKIDALVAKKQALIERLKEKRTALIARTVTRGLPPDAARAVGLDPHPRLKPSGIDWLGDVPEHWETGNLRRFAQMKTGHTPSRSEPDYWEDCDIPWFTLADVWQLRDERQIYLGETKEQISQLGLANSAAELLPAGTVVFSRTASIGFSGIMPRQMATTQDFWNWIPGPRLWPEYLLYQFRAMRQEFERLTMGSTHKTIYQPDAARLCVAVPPVDEQEAIAEHLRTETAKLDGLTDRVETAIERLQEYRTALITAAVTGKIDVRGTAA